MAEEQETYLNHLERWLNYEDELDSPPLAHGVIAKTAGDSVQRTRHDSFINEGRPKVALEVAAQKATKLAAKSEQVSDARKFSNVRVRFPLPSCARDEADEQYAGGEELDNQREPASTMVQKVKNVLGL